MTELTRDTFNRKVDGLAHLGRIYIAHFKTMTAIHLQYRVALIIWLIGIVLEPTIYLVVWTTVAKAGGGSVGGFDISELAAYFIASMNVNHLTFTWHMWEYDYNIREGLLSPRLLRPYHPIHADIAENLSYKAITLLVMLPTNLFMIAIFRPSLQPDIQTLAVFFPVLALAFLIQFLLGWALAMAAFWTTRISAINRVYFLGKLFLAGQLAPLALLPPAIQIAASISPFRWMLSFPIELLMGRVSGQATVTGILAQLAWLLLSLGAVKLTWRAGIRRYSAFGA